ncbi:MULTISPECIES: Holliday junction resolvase RuvX [Sphingomonadales]|uniref:Holliday junction resolvase RuvX n=1 Tax=Sphingomonadales TaxID=204457 RepID=UPI0001DD10B8|nr:MULTISPECIES: Holliday junction resolvase RuvX [Sphingomonadales]ALG60914.1 Holliday junction resolvase [Citromicrobium sp. JL477]KPM13395.1 Holliday junction resolvase [Citromicrobium sp. JL1351]KPM14791.1 Holliday junction resolvase [Citromicrobium sp. JL31]KPM22243.1 Holliday junction resolvase [Citromicrobium sp. JL2201]
MDSRELVGESAAGLAETLPDGGALIGLDLGTKTIGIAVCDAGWRFASALKTLPRGKFGRDRDELRKLIEARSIRGIVIGLPRNMDGSEGPRAQASRAYARNLAEAFGLPVLLWDERWSTKSAEDAMIGLDVSRRKRAERIDAEAATIILQGAIDTATGSPLL